MTCGCSNSGREAQITEMAAVNAELKAKLAEIRATCEYWNSDEFRLPIALRQGARQILAILDGGTE